MDLRMSGLRCVVAGGSAGLGAATATAASAEGARVAIVARRSTRLNDLAATAQAHAIEADLASPEGPRAAIEEAVAALGGLDLLLVNNGGPPAGTFADLTEARWREAFDMALWGPLRLLAAALPHLRESTTPAILMILSSSAREPIPGLTTSNLIRPGLAGLVKSLAGELAPIRINAVAPGKIATGRVAGLDALRAEQAGVSAAEVQRRAAERIPLGRYGEPVEVGRVACFLLSPAASYVTGAIVPIDGGMVSALP